MKLRQLTSYARYGGRQHGALGNGLRGSILGAAAGAALSIYDDLADGPKQGDVYAAPIEFFDAGMCAVVGGIAGALTGQRGWKGLVITTTTVVAGMVLVDTIDTEPDALAPYSPRRDVGMGALIGSVVWAATRTLVRLMP